MAQYSHRDNLFQCKAPLFDEDHEPGVLARERGIYRCKVCGEEIVANERNPLPPGDDHMHENGEPIVWQLLVFAQGFDREDRSYLDDDPEAWIDESEGIVEEVDRHQACKWAISKEFSAMFKAGVDKGWSEAEVLAAITDSADIATLGHGHASEVETLLNNIARKAAENSKG